MAKGDDGNWLATQTRPEAEPSPVSPPDMGRLIEAGKEGRRTPL